MPLGDRVDDHGAARGPGCNHRPAGEERIPFRQPTPHRHAVPLWWPFAGIECLTHCGVNSIAPDQQIGSHANNWLPCDSISEVATNTAGLGPTELGKPTVGVDAGCAKPGRHGAVEHPEELAAVDRELWPVVASCNTSRFTPYLLPMSGVEHPFGGGNSYGGQLIEQTELSQLANGMREEVDPNAKLLHSRRGLVDVHVTEACVDERKSERHSADTAAHDRDLHRTAPPRCSKDARTRYSCRSNRY